MRVSRIEQRSCMLIGTQGAESSKMAGIIHIAHDASLPHGADWVMIIREKAEAFFGIGPSMRSGGTIFHAPAGEDMVAAIASACLWADANGISAVHLRGLPNAPRR